MLVGRYCPVCSCLVNRDESRAAQLGWSVVVASECALGGVVFCHLVPIAVLVCRFSARNERRLQDHDERERICMDD